MAKYGINEWESIGDSEKLNELLTNILKDKMSPYLHPDNFLITIEMERTDITIYDSNYVEVTYPNIMKFNEKADINNQPCHFTVNMIPPNVKNLVISSRNGVTYLTLNNDCNCACASFKKKSLMLIGLV